MIDVFSQLDGPFKMKEDHLARARHFHCIGNTTDLFSWRSGWNHSPRTKQGSHVIYRQTKSDQLNGWSAKMVVIRVYLMLRKQLAEVSNHSGATRVAPQRYWPLRNSVACQGNRPSTLARLSHPPRFGRIPHNWLLQVTFTNWQVEVVGTAVTCRFTIECHFDDFSKLSA